MKRTMTYFACVSIFVLVVASPACQSLSKDDTALVQAVHTELQEDLTIARTQAEAEPDNQDLLKLIGRIEGALATIEPFITSPSTEIGISGVLTEAAKYLPSEYGLIATLAASGLATFFGKRSGKTRETMRNLVGTLEQLKGANNTVVFNQETARALNVALGKFGKLIVDEGQGDRTPLPF